MSRISWDEYFSRIVMTTSERSPCERLQVGCLLVNDNRIVSQGYNGFLPGCPHESIVRDKTSEPPLTVTFFKLTVFCLNSKISH